MGYVVVSARFKFFDGKRVYTVEYTYAIEKWFVFLEEEHTGAVYVKADKKIKTNNVNNYKAELILNEYLEINF